MEVVPIAPRGKPMAWDVTVPDTYAESHIDQTHQHHLRLIKVVKTQLIQSTCGKTINQRVNMCQCLCITIG